MYNRGGTDYANRATNQMQGAAGTLSAMTRKQEVKTKRPDTTFSDVVTSGMGAAMLGNEVSDMDLFDFMTKKTPQEKAAETTKDTLPADDYLLGDDWSVLDPLNDWSAIDPLAREGQIDATSSAMTPVKWSTSSGGGAVNTGAIEAAFTNANLGPSAMNSAPVITAQTGIQTAGGPLAANGLGGSISTTGGAAIEAGTGLASTSAMEAATGGTVSAGAVDSALAGVGTSGLMETAGGAGAALGGAATVSAASLGSQVAAMSGAEAAAAADALAASITTTELGGAAAPALASNPAGWIVGGAIGLGAIGAYLFS